MCIMQYSSFARCVLRHGDHVQGKRLYADCSALLMCCNMYEVRTENIVIL